LADSGAGGGAGRKAFFSEEKKQKTFIYEARLKSQKFFGSFFQKRTSFLLQRRLGGLASTWAHEAHGMSAAETKRWKKECSFLKKRTKKLLPVACAAGDPATAGKRL
jgi:hypothetical protein